MPFCVGKNSALSIRTPFSSPKAPYRWRFFTHFEPVYHNMWGLGQPTIFAAFFIATGRIGGPFRQTGRGIPPAGGLLRRDSEPRGAPPPVCRRSTAAAGDRRFYTVRWFIIPCPRSECKPESAGYPAARHLQNGAQTAMIKADKPGKLLAGGCRRALPAAPPRCRRARRRRSAYARSSRRFSFFCRRNRGAPP